MKNKISTFLKNRKKGFTLIELLVVIGVLAVLVLLGAPRLLGYTQKAELVRIQHDVKVMETEMEIDFLNKVNINGWDTNRKDLSALIVDNKLYEKEGYAESIDASHIGRDGVLNLNTNVAGFKDNVKSQLASIPNSEELGVGGSLIPIKVNNSLFDSSIENFSIDETYKVIPEEYKGRIKTKLGGTFYTSSRGKVYYEHSKPLTHEYTDNKRELACVEASTLGYEFSVINGKGTITGWNGTEVHLIIPDSFLLEIDGVEECVPVRVIGRAAFMNKNLGRVQLPKTVEIIEEDAFKGNNLTRVELHNGVREIGNGAFEDNNITNINIPHSVNKIGSNAFAGNSFSDGTIIIYNKETNITIGNNAFGGYAPAFKTPRPKDVGVLFEPESGTIVSNTSSTSSTSSTSNTSRTTTVVIPEFLEVGGVEYPVKNIAKGAYQGSGIISVQLPSGLERIEDYAFAGNRIVEVIIPEPVNHIGNYAFAFNELVHTETYDVKPTINYVEIKGTDYFGQINEQGNIVGGVQGVNLLDHIFITSIHAEEVGQKPVAVISATNVDEITADREVDWDYSESTSFNNKDIVSAEWDNKQSRYPKGQHKIGLRVKDSAGIWSDWTYRTFTVTNSAPSTPEITRTPNTNGIAPGTPITLTAQSFDADGDEVRYEWKIENHASDGTVTEVEHKTTRSYPLGRNIVTVKAIDSQGSESAVAGEVFFVVDSRNNTGGMTLEGPHSTIIEEGIPGASIVKYEFNVPSVSGHNGNDYGTIKGFNIETQKWEQIAHETTSNGIKMTGTLPIGKYSKLEMYYYASHCMYGKSNITYSVDFNFM